MNRHHVLRMHLFCVAISRKAQVWIKQHRRWLSRCVFSIDSPYDTNVRKVQKVFLVFSFTVCKQLVFMLRVSTSQIDEHGVSYSDNRAQFKN